MGMINRIPRHSSYPTSGGASWGTFQWIKLVWSLPSAGLCQLSEIEVNGATPPNIYASSQYDSGEFATANLIDGNTGTKWSSAAGSEGDPVWIAVKMTAAQTITEYAYYPRANNVVLAPSGFALYGSNDSTNGADGAWTLIATGLEREDNEERRHEWGP